MSKLPGPARPSEGALRLVEGGDAPAAPSSATSVDGQAAAHKSTRPPHGEGHGVIGGLIKTLRPHQWVKNLFVMAPMVFHKDVFATMANGDPALNLNVAGRAFAATGVFCLLAGAVYTINDLADLEADRVHPVKRNRPIASGLVPASIARAMALALVLLCFGMGYLLSPWFALVAALYFGENVLYTFKLKQVPILDVSLIALGFVLRVVAGGLATNVHVSEYMLACTALLALFLGFGKRRHELASENAGKQRAVLKAYSAGSLNILLGVTGAATIVTYVAYTLDPTTQAFFDSKLLWLTAPFTAFGIGRFLFLVSGRAGRGIKAESPTQEMLRDVPFVLNLVLWAIVVVAIVYRLRPST